MPDSLQVRRALLLGLVLAATACNAPKPGRNPPLQPQARQAAQPKITLRGSFSDGTPLTLDALKGRPWVVNLWLPG